MSGATAEVDYTWYGEQEKKIWDHVAESRRLRAERRRLFDPGHLYVAEFDSGVVKVGKADNAESRLAAHAKTGLVRSSWTSPRHLHCSKTERELIAFCNEYGTLHGGREYFRDISFEIARAYAFLVVQNALRADYLARLVSAVNGDMSKTWAEAQACLEAIEGGTE